MSSNILNNIEECCYCYYKQNNLIAVNNSKGKTYKIHLNCYMFLHKQGILNDYICKDECNINNKLIEYMAKSFFEHK